MLTKSESVMFTASDTAGVPAVTAIFGLVPARVILLPEAMKLTGYSGASLHRLEIEGSFRPAVKLARSGLAGCCQTLLLGCTRYRTTAPKAGTRQSKVAAVRPQPLFSSRAKAKDGVL